MLIIFLAPSQMKQLIRLSCLRRLNQANKVLVVFLSDKLLPVAGRFSCQSISLVSSYFVLNPPQKILSMVIMQHKIV